ncbi:MAG: cysteine--tRNA ligase [candidate division NC10 bacterium]|nr:cysteine--tRNA ligase [candidate division NC10 bacterium]
MALRLYNTLTERKEELVPIAPGEVRMYVCGITAYDLCHLGHARSLLVFEVLRRYLAFRGYRVRMVRNFTDVDDKIIRKAQETGRTWKAVADHYIQEFQADMARFELPPADMEPRATDHVPAMVALTESLLARGLAYAVDGDVYFRVRGFPGYGRLSRRNLDDLRAGARVEVDERKEDPLDFSLWKRAKPGEPAWESPWGPGRPGWHIECSAMAMELLGESFDLHGGGEDLIFPHHENEIAQSEGATGKPFARHWVHNGFVRIEQEKMSKSVGNVFTIRDLLGKFSPDALKLFLLGSHYRGPIDYAPEKVEEAGRALDRIRLLAESVEALEEHPRGGALPAAVGAARGEFVAAMDDDLNTARALSAIFTLVRHLNGALDRLPERRRATAAAAAAFREGIAAIREMGQVLGLRLSGGATRPAEEAALSAVAALLREYCPEQVAAAPDLSAGVEALLARREGARRARDFTVADAIRRRLAAAGIEVADRPQGSTWRLRTK